MIGDDVEARILARRSALQAIYQWQMTRYDLSEIERQFVEEHGLGKCNVEYFKELLHEVPARIMDLDDRRVCEIAMVENLQREDLGAIEKATAFKAYLDQFQSTQDELAEKLGLERSTVS
ncbi:MAG: hypothetical protein ACKN9T_16120, partial [Candidatus Methylumidiphilus sp.]